ncbi:MAG TPA: ABC transporter permease [Thermoanaerobaculia bacterium]|nr:ABC transporter permease [Thermoanaerobaculia bacterium]
MRDFVQDLRYAIRQMARKPGMTLFAVLSLALGIGANSSIFSLVNAILFRELPAQRPQELVDVYGGKEKEFQYATWSYPDFADVRTWNGVFTEIAALNLTIATYDDGRKTDLLFGEQVTANFFRLYGLQPALGRDFLPEEDVAEGKSPVLLLGHRAWKERFGGDPGIVGKTLKLNGQYLTVVGVAPEIFKGSFPGVSSDFWVPMHVGKAMSGQGGLDERGSRSLFVKARLKPGVDLERAQAEVNALVGRLRKAYPQEDEGLTSTLVSTREVVLNPGIDGPIIGVAGLLMGVVGLVLLIACFNIANLLLVRAAERRREIAVRLAIGASRGRLIRQLLTESVLLALLGGLAGLLIAIWTARLIVAFKPPLPIPLNLDVPLDWRVLAFTLGIALLTGILCGLAPALQSTRPGVVTALKDEEGGLMRHHRKLGLRNLLVVAQVAISALLLVGAGLFLRSLGSAQSIDPGFRLRNGVAVQVALELGGAYDETRGRAFYERLLERTRVLPGVRSASLTEHLPLGLNVHVSDAQIEGRPKPRKGEELEVDRNGVMPGYFETLGIPLVAGRDVTAADRPGAQRVAIINQTAARQFWPGEDPLGKRLRLGESGEWMTVIGVARDGKYRTLGEAPRAFVYTNNLQQYSSFMTLVIATDGNEQAMLEQVRRELDALDPNLPVFDIATLSEHLSIMLFPARLGAALLAAFGALGLVLAGIGLYGVVASSVARRTREVGIRMSLGARRADVLALVVREGMTLTGIGLAIGLGLALLASQVLSGLLYGIGTHDPMTYLIVAVVLGGIALFANLVPAGRATQVQPVVALKYD